MLALPLHDLPTRSASGFLIRHVVPRAEPPQLVGPLDRKALFSTLSAGDAIIGVGHGDPARFSGYRDQVLIDLSSIPDVRGKVVVLISCQTARQLGPALINAGADSYIGFLEDLVWVMDAESASTPWADKFAAPAMMPIVNCVNTILDGKVTADAFVVLTNELMRNAAVEEEDELIAACLRFNAKNASLLGNPMARVKARPKVAFPLPPPPLFPYLA
uniref:CHAT domain-containing protein n=1 Tax=viral metagenome TaxID=1070528 RepID=A0A6H1Z7F4_9ZZZZ